MELLRGLTLTQLVQGHGPLQPSHAIHLALQVANALSEAHQHGIVHRDIKPENVFVLSSEGVEDFVKLLDFGIAKRRDSTEVPLRQVTGTGMVVGTPAFMAPEVALGQRADFRADVYGLGTLLLFMLTAQAPPEADTARLAKAVPRDLAHVVWRCLASNPDGRYPDARAFAAALSALDGVPAWRSRLGPPTQAPASPAAEVTRTRA
jgi:eukaryotic-like serine/threonine-protein kinase